MEKWEGNKEKRLSRLNMAISIHKNAVLAKERTRNVTAVKDVLSPQLKWQYALVYIDDVIVFSKSVEEHFVPRLDRPKSLQRPRSVSKPEEMFILHRLRRLLTEYNTPRKTTSSRENDRGFPRSQGTPNDN